MRTRTSWGRTRLLVALSMLVAAAATTSMGSASPIPVDKIHPDVVSALLNGEDPVNLIVGGHPHVGITAGSFPSRAAAKAALNERSRDFFDAVRDVVAAHGGTVNETWGIGPAVHVLATPETVNALADLPEVRTIERDAPDAVGLIQPLPSTGLEPANSGGRQLIQAEDIWALGFRGEGIKISFIDTGIDATHEAFKNADGSSRVVAWKDWVGTSPTPYDDQGHGTHVAGTGAGSDLFNDPTFGTFQEVGVANRATIMVTKFLDSTGGGSFANAINALQWSYDNGADITSNSWGGSCSASLGVIQVVRQLTDLGMLSVFAAGNSGSGAGTVGGPACGESALSVGSIDQNKVIAASSSRGPCSDPDTGTGSRICPDVVAKGVAVRSSAARGSCSLCNSTGYISLNGTSMATPHVAGAAALIEQMKRFYSGTGWDTAARAEEEVFKLTTEDLGVAGPDNTYGWGLPQLLNIYALLNASDDAVIVDTFGITQTVARLGDTSVLSFGVRNLGGAIATGTFTAKLIDPNGGETLIKSSTPSLGLLDGESATHTMVVNGSLIPGDYTFRGTFDYSWQDGNGDTQTGSVLREGTIKVARVFVDMALDVAPEASVVLPQDVTFTATNTGNEDAAGVVLEVTFPDDYLFFPGENFTPANLNSRFSNPTPNRVVEDRNFGRVTLIFDVGTLAQRQSFSFTATLIPTTPGTYRTLGVAKFKDGAGKGFAQGSSFQQTVVLPA